MHFVCLLLLPFCLSGQGRSWSGVSFEHEVNPVWGYALDAEYRTKFDNFNAGGYLLTLNGDRKLSELFHLSFGGRISPTRNGVPTEGRLFTDPYYDRDPGNGPFSLRSGYVTSKQEISPPTHCAGWPFAHV